MKKIYMTMVALLCGVAAMAQTASLTVPEKLEIAAGDEGELVIGMTSSQPLAAVAFRIGFPEGSGLSYEMVQDWDDDANDGEGGYVDVPEFDYTLNADRMQGHGAAIQFCADEEGFVQVAITSNPVKIFKGTEGDLITLKFKAAADAKSGDVIFKKVAASTTKGKSVSMEDVTIPLTVGGTGINGVNAENSNAPIYNLAGQRVSKAQKGIFIQNGKKAIK